MTTGTTRGGPLAEQGTALLAEHFVGRIDELARVKAACRAAEEGRGTLTVVTGEAGIGKTRLCQEVVTRARELGCTAIMARCWGEGGAPAYWPWQPVLEELCGPDTADLLVTDASLPGADRDRFARFAAVTEELVAACHRSPVILVIDDIHAADAGTLLLTRFVARSLPRLELALVLGRRSEEPADGTIERELLDEIESEAMLVALRRFDADETAEFLAVHGLQDVDQDTVDVVARITRGHPLFLRRVALSGSGALPGTEPRRAVTTSTSRGLRSAIVQAFVRLSAPALKTMRLSAVLGAAPSISQAAAVAETNIPAVLDALREATASGLVISDGPSHFTFTHELVRTALEDMLGPAERLDAHARAAAVIGGDLRSATSEQLVRCAHHALAAAPRSPADGWLAVSACRAAAHSLVDSFAYEQADGFLTAAIALYEPVSLGPPPGRLLVEWAQAALLCGRLAEARSRFARAVTAAEQEDDPVLLAEAALGLGGYWLTEARPLVERTQVEALQQSALAGLPDEEVALHTRLTARLAAEDFYNGGPIEPMEEALDAARRCGDPVALADALSLCHHALMRPEHAHWRLELADELVRVGAEAGHGVLGLMGLCWRTVDLFQLGDPRATRALEGLRHRADALACQALLYIVEVIDITLLIRAGQLDEAEKRAKSALDMGQMVGDSDAFVYYGAQFAEIRWLQGRSQEMVGLIDGIASSPQLHDADFAYLAAGAVFACDAGLHDRAREVLDRLTADGLAALPRSSTWLVGMMTIAELAAALDDRRVAREVYDLLQPFADLPIVPSLGICCFGSTHRPLGIAARTLGDLELALDHFEQAIATNQRLGNRPMVAMARAELAAMLGSSSLPPSSPYEDGKGLWDPQQLHERQERADDLFTKAIERADAMGMTGRVEAWRAERDQLRSRTRQRNDEDPSSRSTGPSRAGVFRREGGGWLVEVDDRRALVGNLVGMGYLAELLMHPGHAIPALALASGYRTVIDTDQHEVLDHQARAAYTARARDLVDDLADAEANADLGRVERLRTELDALVEQLQEATGLAGRPRVFTGPSERARTAVRKAIMRAINAIEEADSEIGAVLRPSIVTGKTCVYTPDPDHPVVWSST